MVIGLDRIIPFENKTTSQREPLFCFITIQPLQNRTKCSSLMRQTKLEKKKTCLPGFAGVSVNEVSNQETNKCDSLIVTSVGGAKCFTFPFIHRDRSP